MQTLRIQQHFIDSAELHYQLAEPLAKPVDAAVQAVLASVTSGGKVLVAGVGGGVSLAQYFTCVLLGGFERERPPLAAVALGGDACAGQADGAGAGLARQVQALGATGDVLVLIGAGAAQSGLVPALQAAHEREMGVIALTDAQAGELGQLLRETDVHIAVPHERLARVQEVQHIVLHCVCDGLDAQLLGDEESMR